MDQKKRAVNPLLRLVPPAQPCQDGDGDFGLVCDHEFRVEPEQLAQVIPAQLRRVNNLIFRRIGQISRANGVEAVTPMHGWIMEYLYRNSDTPVFQRDIEREFSITRSTVTNILQLMERKGYIARQSVAQDARLKQLVLTEKGRQFHENTMLALHQTDEYVASLLTEEENTELLRLLNKLYLGLK